MEKDFDRWNKLKKVTDGKDEAARLFFREGEVWWIHLGANIGYETDGKRADFARPVVVLKKYNQFSFLALPLSTANKRNRYWAWIGNVDGKGSASVCGWSLLREAKSQWPTDCPSGMPETKALPWQGGVCKPLPAAQY